MYVGLKYNSYLCTKVVIGDTLSAEFGEPRRIPLTGDKDTYAVVQIKFSQLSFIEINLFANRLIFDINIGNS